MVCIRAKEEKEKKRKKKKEKEKKRKKVPLKQSEKIPLLTVCYICLVSSFFLAKHRKTD